MWTKWARLYQVVHFTCLILTISKGQTCSFMETSGQKGVDSLRSNTGNTTTDVDGCKTLCNTTDLCIAGEFLSSTNTCYMYSLETTLTAQADTVFFQWDCTNETETSITTPSTTTTTTTTFTPPPPPTTTTTTLTPTTTTTLTPTTTTSTATTTTTTPATTTLVSTLRATLNQVDRDLNQKGKIASAVSACAFFGVCVVLLMIIIFFRKGRKRDDEKQNWTTYTGRT
ncbi:ponticulin-like protein H isoform X2 [Haliotis asinina]|uniref:ponticulin-like protein H isoform X2 n=1 Tax=Haliotis asinina TaxID=109174 RepID=UPI00353264FE